MSLILFPKKADASVQPRCFTFSSPASVYKKPQTIYDIRSVYARSTPDIVGKVSAPPKGTKQRPLDKAVYENEDIVSDLTRLLVTKMNIELEPNSYGEKPCVNLTSYNWLPSFVAFPISHLVACVCDKNTPASSSPGARQKKHRLWSLKRRD